jgi:hypothetical protein
LAQRFQIHVVCAWIGNSALIAQKHYTQVTEADFETASAPSKAPDNAAWSGTSSTDPQTEMETPEKN